MPTRSQLLNLDYYAPVLSNAVRGPNSERRAAEGLRVFTRV
jgi:hypothetical protein